MSKTLATSLLNEAGKKTSIRVSNVKEDPTEAELKTTMELILA